MSAFDLLPWQGAALNDALENLSSPASLIHGEPGSGQLEMALNVARAWLCEAPRPDSAASGASLQPACGHCPSCHLVTAGYHPDLKVVLPETLRNTLGWEHGEDDASADKAEAKKRKPSAEIKVDALREVVTFSQRTVSRGRVKVVLIHPAERMNTVAANTVLKTLEEPPGKVRFVLGCEALDDLLPTVRSRCQAWRLPPPDPALVRRWLQEQHAQLSDDDAELLLAAAGGSPRAALSLLALGWSGAAWRRLPADAESGMPGVWAGWPLTMVIDTLQKLCHDLACHAVGGAPRYFRADDLPAHADLERLTAWSAELRQARRHGEHPWNATLKAEALLLQARRAMR